MTHSQRFDVQHINGGYYAPYTWGCPSMNLATDYSVFKKTELERGKLATFKAKLPKTRNHKFVSILHAQF